MNNIQVSDKQGTNAVITEVGFGVNELDTVDKLDVPAYQLTAEKLGRWLMEIRNQPNAWRIRADVEDSYFDGDQIDSDTIEALRERGQSPIIDNQISPVIRTCLGQQAKSRMNTVVKPEAGETNIDVAEALSCKLKEYSVMCESDRAKSDAYADMIKTGIGWLEVSTNDDPFAPPFTYQHIHRREMFYDWRAKPNMSDARYLVRRKWIDEDQLIMGFPEQKDFITNSLRSSAAWDAQYLTGDHGGHGHHDDDMGFNLSVEQYEWMNVARKRLLTYEVWYRVKVRDKIFKMPNGKVVEFDLDNPMHVMLAESGVIEPEDASFDRIRVAFFIGTKLIGDYKSPYKHRKFPYVPMFCFRENKTHVPYGLIRTMISPQDEINARKTKMNWMLNAKTVIATDGAVADHEEAANEAARPDGYVIISNKPNEKFEIHENQQMSQQQYQVMIEAKESLQTNAGIHSSTMGNQSNASSGVAVNALMENDAVSLAEPNDNFNMSCRYADTIFTDLIIDKISKSKDHSVTIDDGNGGERVVVLNQMGVDPNTGLPTITNDITKVNVTVVLADAPQTATFKNQILQQTMEMIKTLPPEAQAQLAPDIIAESDLPNAKAMADKLRKCLGQDGKSDPEKERLKQQVQELTQKLEAKNPPEIIAATVQKLTAETENIKAHTVETSAKGLYEAMQTAQAVAANPAVVPIADAIGKSIGFEDKNGYPIIQGQPVQQGLGQQIPQDSEMQYQQGANPQHNPTLPPLPAEINTGQPRPLQTAPQLDSPATCVAMGIEKQGNQL